MRHFISYNLFWADTDHTWWYDTSKFTFLKVSSLNNLEMDQTSRALTPVSIPLRHSWHTFIETMMLMVNGGYRNHLFSWTLVCSLPANRKLDRGILSPAGAADLWTVVVIFLTIAGALASVTTVTQAVTLCVVIFVSVEAVGWHSNNSDYLFCYFLQFVCKVSQVRKFLSHFNAAVCSQWKVFVL